MNITESNKLIAEFMGAIHPEHLKAHELWLPVHGICRWDTVGIGCGKTLKYHESWDWLMPVVERIQKEGFKTSIENNWTSIDGIWFETTGANLNILQATYEAVVKFIKWYNENKQQ